MATLFVEQLTVIDCAYLDDRRGVVGESWIVDVELDGALNAQGMIEDFGPLKRTLKRAIDEIADHRLLVPLRHAGLRIDTEIDAIALRFTGAQVGTVDYRSPVAAVCPLPTMQVDTAALTTLLESRLQSLLPGNVHRLRLHLHREDIDGAWYRYAHGLRQHDGNCQHIAHGHRSRLQVLVNGRRDGDCEARLAAAWADVYLGCRADLVTADGGRLHFAYRTARGAYELALPETCCEVIDVDSTVENLATLLAQRAAAMRRGQRIEVRAYEGVHKGALARIDPV